jgi:hypothetical protein
MFLQSYGAIFTDRAATGSGNLMDLMSTPNLSSRQFWIFKVSFEIVFCFGCFEYML